MTAPECVFLLANGQKCRCAAKRGQPFCRHHDPAASATCPTPEHQRFSRHRRWIAVSRDLPSLDPAFLPTEILEILEALLSDGEDGISDRVAGRLLRILLRRIGHVPFAIPDAEPANCPTPEAEPRAPSQPSLAPEDIARALDETDRMNAMLGSLLGIHSKRLDPEQFDPKRLDPKQPDLSQMHASLPQMPPHVRQMQPHVRQMQPHPVSHPAASALHAAVSQLTPMESPGPHHGRN